MDRLLVQSHRRETSAAPRYAVVLKTYVWDDFIARQARRCAARAGGGDFFVLLDESQSPGISVPGNNVVRTSNAALLELGFADRFEEGSLIWWNADYPHYHFHHLHPDYDFYVFVEYDAMFGGDFETLISTCAKLDVDLAVGELEVPKESWNWTQLHLRTYGLAELEGCLMSISVLSAKALRWMEERRRAMAQDPDVHFWPSAEVFMPTEAKRAGLNCVALAALGDTQNFRWRPPLLEEELFSQPTNAFFHPVYDRKRFVRWALEQGATLKCSLDSQGPVLPHLARLPVRAYLPAFAAKLARTVLVSAKARCRGLLSLRQPSSEVGSS